MSLHPVCAFLLHLRCSMGVCVQRKGRGVVSEVALYRFDIVPCPDGCDGVGVAQIVKTGIRQACGFHQFLVSRADGLMTQVLANLISEHKAGNVSCLTYCAFR